MSFDDTYVLNHNECSTKITFGERILQILEHQKRTKAWLAEEIGVSKQVINYLLNHSSKIKFENEIANALGVNPDWLVNGRGKMILNALDNDDVHYLPLIPINDVSEFKHDLKNRHKTVLASNALHKNCFAIVLENTSMEPQFSQGTILIFDPTLKPKNADYVIFTIKETNSVFFRQFFIDGNNIYLKATNNMYKNIENEAIRIHGVLVESRNCFK